MYARAHCRGKGDTGDWRNNIRSRNSRRKNYRSGCAIAMSRTVESSPRTLIVMKITREGMARDGR
jgi:hypothetical protein